MLASDAAGATHRESWQLFEVDRQLGAEQLERISTTLTANSRTCGSRRATGSPCCGRRVAASLELQSPGVPHDADAAKAQALIEWMVEGHFTFLGYRRYRLRRGTGRDLLMPHTQPVLGYCGATAREPALRHRPC